LKKTFLQENELEEVGIIEEDNIKNDALEKMWNLEFVRKKLKIILNEKILEKTNLVE
jgi:hypothetical protein